MLKKLCLVFMLLLTFSACKYDDAEVTTTNVPGIGRRGPESVSGVDQYAGVDDGGDLANLNSDGNSDGDNTGDDNGSGDGAGAGTETQDYFASHIGDRIFFALDSSNISSEGQAILNRQVGYLKQHPNIKVTIEGHADERGTREYNLALGDRRSISIKNYLTAQGIGENRIQTISYGKEKPVKFSSDDTSYGENRRGVTVISK